MGPRGPLGDGGAPGSFGGFCNTISSCLLCAVAGCYKTALAVQWARLVGLHLHNLVYIANFSIYLLRAGHPGGPPRRHQLPHSAPPHPCGINRHLDTANRRALTFAFVSLLIRWGFWGFQVRGRRQRQLGSHWSTVAAAARFVDSSDGCLRFVCCCWLLQDCFGGPMGPPGGPPGPPGPSGGPPPP
ncbi:hypothetical protein Ddye_025439 [Dipteronia dyeriana]|uniref:Uncharacterized protein n=1 Tax=Dipteronia dyeriana TaxID=168575 RepID=A0AAD9TK75_9ROSI|nr:hypothetical protein Ddye_025439 [Dipteronia dyeriana]